MKKLEYFADMSYLLTVIGSYINYYNHHQVKARYNEEWRDNLTLFEMLLSRFDNTRKRNLIAN